MSGSEGIALAGLFVHREIVTHPLLGDAHVIARLDLRQPSSTAEGRCGPIEHGGEPITAMSAIDWDAPARIPTIAEPRRLPPGAGTALLNEIARRAERAGVRALRYAGPYPTPALFASLRRSFRPLGDEATFCADVLGRALRVARDEVPVDFVPAPFERAPLPCGYVDIRDGVERASLAGVLYDREGARGSFAQLVARDDGWNAELRAGEVVWARTARLDRQGALVEGPSPVPACPAPLDQTSATLRVAARPGKAGAFVSAPFPDELRAVLPDLIEDEVLEILRADARRLVLERPIAWADLGSRIAARAGDGFAVHGILLALRPALGVTRLVQLLAAALADVVTSAIVGELDQQLGDP